MKFQELYVVCQISNDEVICLTKPNNFQIDEQVFGENLPINQTGKNLKLESLVYTIPKTIYYSQIAVVKAANLALLTTSLEQFALIFNINHNNITRTGHNFLLINCNLETTKLSLFHNSTLFTFSTIKIGLKQIAANLIVKMPCFCPKVTDYLRKIINISSTYLNNMIIYEYFDDHTKTTIKITKVQLQAIVCQHLNEIFAHINHFLTSMLLKNGAIKLIFTGKITLLSGFTTYVKKIYFNKNIIIMVNTIPSIDNCK